MLPSTLNDDHRHRRWLRSNEGEGSTPIGAPEQCRSCILRVVSASKGTKVRSCGNHRDMWWVGSTVHSGMHWKYRRGYVLMTCVRNPLSSRSSNAAASISKGRAARRVTFGRKMTVAGIAGVSAFESTCADRVADKKKSVTTAVEGV